jgi:hypothetical protein
MDGVTPGPWVAKQTVIHKNEYGGWWLEGIDLDPEDATRPERLILISGSGGARSYTTRIIDRQIHDDNEANMKWFALCSPDNIGALLDTIASLRSKLEEAEGALDEAYRIIGKLEECAINDIMYDGRPVAAWCANYATRRSALATKPAVKDDETVVEALDASGAIDAVAKAVAELQRRVDAGEYVIATLITNLKTGNCPPEKAVEWFEAEGRAALAAKDVRS